MRSPDEFNAELISRFMRWLVIQHYAQGTIGIYRNILAAYKASLGQKLVTEATHHDVLEFLTSGATRGLSMRSLHSRLDSLRVFYDFLKLGGFQMNSPAKVFRLRQVQRKIPRILSEGDVRTLIANSRTLRDRVLIELLYGTGCRLGEIASLRLENIDFNSRTILVEGKTGARTVLFGKEAAKAILSYVGKRRHGNLFSVDYPTQCGSVRRERNLWIGKWMDYDRRFTQPIVARTVIGEAHFMSREQAKRRFSQLVAERNLVRPEREKPPRPETLQESLAIVSLKAGLGRVTPRMLRHTFATHMVNHGASTRAIQQLMGHAWLQSTEIYTHISKQRVRETFAECHPRGA